MNFQTVVNKIFKISSSFSSEKPNKKFFRTGHLTQSFFSKETKLQTKSNFSSNANFMSK